MDIMFHGTSKEIQVLLFVIFSGFYVLWSTNVVDVPYNFLIILSLPDHFRLVYAFMDERTFMDIYLLFRRLRMT